MIKIFLTIRNRLSITKKCIEAIKRHSTIKHQIYIYDNLTNYKLKEHWEYLYNLFRLGLVSQVTFNSTDSTFNAFSKAVASNQFGYLHMNDPMWNTYDFLVILDNDIIVFPGWDSIILSAWEELKKRSMYEQIHIITFLPGGITMRKQVPFKICDREVQVGRCSGSGFWCVKNSFFKDIGYLDIKTLVGHDKRHDSSYWNLLERKSRGKEYVLGIGGKPPLCFHCGGIAGSICNTLSRNKSKPEKYELIKFKESEEKIDSMSFDEFMSYVRGMIK